MKALKAILSVFLVLCLVFPMAPAYAAETDGEASRETAAVRGVNNFVTIDDDATGGYVGDYVVIYNPATSSSTSYSTGTMTGLIETSVNASVKPVELQQKEDERPSCIIDVDGVINEENRANDPNYGVIREGNPTRATSYNVGDTKSFTISSYNPGSGSSLTFKVVAKGQHCYIWTPSQNVTNYYTLDSIDSTYPQLAADEFDRMYDLMNSSFGNHSNGSNGDGRVSLLFYNIDDGWNGSGGFVAGYFSSASYSYDGMPIINIDTYPGVYYKTSSGNEGKSMDIAFSTACHEYQHCINYSNTSSMSTWLNECFSAAAEEICYPGSSVVSRIQSWENYYFSDNNDWDNPPKEVAYQSSWNLHKGYSMYTWSNSLEMDDTLALYAQVSFFAQYLYTRFGNSIYKQISNKYSSSETTAITNATGVSCANLVRDFRIACTANAVQSQYNGIYGFVAQDGYNPEEYHNVVNPWSLLSPVIFTGSSCSIKGGGAITVKPVNGVYNPPSGANSNLRYFGISLAAPYTVTAVSNNESWGTVSVSGSTITCTPANGYYVQGYEVTAGAATCTLSGNTITVAPESDCTIRVIFAAKPTYTVNFIACGASMGSQSALINDEITLPATATEAEGWTFSGWTGAQLAETTDKPAYYAPGAAYTVTGNATLYALYTRVEEGSGEVVYQLVDTLEDGGKYIIVDSNSISGTSAYAVGNTIVASNHYLAAVSVTISDGICTVSDSNLPKVLWDAAAVSGGYTFYNENVGKYMGLDSSEYLYPSATALAWAYTSNKYLDNQTDSEGYYYLSFDTTNIRYTTNKSGKVINFYQQTETETTYYTTDPVVVHVHEWGEPAYTWAKNGSDWQCTAERICGTCDETETETVTAVRSENGDTAIYTAAFTNEAFETQTKEVEIAYYLIGSMTDWSVDEAYAFVPNTAAGEYMLAATLSIGDELKVVRAEDGNILTWYPSGNNYTVVYATSGSVNVYFRPAGNYWNDFHEGGYFYISRLHTVTVVTDGNGTAALDPAAPDYTATVTVTATPNDGYHYDRTELYKKTGEGENDIELVDLNWNEEARTFVMPDFDVVVKVYFAEHTYGEPSYVWADDNSTVTATVSCTVCGHEVTETVETSYEVITPATTEAPGLGRYTAEFDSELFTTQTKDVEIPQLPIEGYHIIVTDYTKGAATTSIDAEALYSGEVTFTVTCDKACVVAIDNGEDSYTRLTCTTVGDEHQFTVTVSNADVTIAIALKGDCNLDGAIKSNDATSAKQAAAGMKTLTGMKLLTVDNNGDGTLRPNEATKVAQVATGGTTYTW